MDKDQADRIINEYIKPLYGFSLHKTRHIAHAEELAGRIVLQVYQALLRKEAFLDLNSYVYKIAHYVWVKFADEQTKTAQHVWLDDHPLPCIDGGYETVVHEETAGSLKLEIAYLSRQQREIVVLHYYEGLKIREIAGRMSLSDGTVKWHLFEAKKELRKAMQTIRTVGNLGINPIKLIDMGHSGAPGKKGDTANFLAKAISQNTAYAAYHKPRTINEIAGELGVSPVYIEDEVDELEQYGFMDKLPGGKYRTNMYIIEPSLQKSEAMHRLFEQYAELAVEQYFDAFFAMEQAFKDTGISIPDDDFNLLLWSVIPYAGRQLVFNEQMMASDDEVKVSRKDGGNYAAYASLDRKFTVSFEPRYYRCAGDMWRSNDHIQLLAWQMDSYWCGRIGGWRDNLDSDYTSLQHYIQGQLPQNEVNIDQYRRLAEKEYLVRTADGFKVNIVYCPDQRTSERLSAAIPPPNDRIRAAAGQLNQAVFELNVAGQPEHAHKYVKYWSQNSIASLEMRAYVLKNLLDRGLLKEPSPQQQKGINTIMFMNKVYTGS